MYMCIGIIVHTWDGAPITEWSLRKCMFPLYSIYAVLSESWIQIGILVNTYDQLRKLFNYDLLTPNVVTYCAKGTRPEVEQVTKYCDSIPFA